MKVKKVRARDYPNLIFQCRIDITADGIPYKYIEDYLKWREYEVVRSICGLHTENQTHDDHIHYHAEVKPIRIYSTEGYMFRRFLEETETSHLNWAVKLTRPTISQDISQNFNELEEEIEKSIISCLAYPLKEKKPIYEGCTNTLLLDSELVDGMPYDWIKALTIQGNAEWEFTKKQRKAKQDKEIQDKMKWTKIKNHLDLKKPKSEYDAFIHLLDFLRTENPTPDPHRIRRMAFNYCYYAKVLTNENIAQAVYGTNLRYVDPQYQNKKTHAETQAFLEKYSTFTAFPEFNSPGPELVSSSDEENEVEPENTYVYLG